MRVFILAALCVYLGVVYSAPADVIEPMAPKDIVSEEAAPAKVMEEVLPAGETGPVEEVVEEASPAEEAGPVNEVEEEVAVPADVPEEAEYGVPDTLAEYGADDTLDTVEVPGYDAVDVLAAGSQEEEQDARVVLCPPGWFRYGSRCFLLVKSARSWLNAETYCMSQGANLASVRSVDEYNFLQSLASLAGQSQVWIGGFNFQGVWMWIDRTGFHYQNWGAQYAASSSPCVYLRTTSGWSNRNCAHSLTFFCVHHGTSC